MDFLMVRTAHTSDERRIGKIRARFQLNVSNLLDEQDVVYTSYTTNATAGGDVPNAFRYQTRRKYTLTTTFSF